MVAIPALGFGLFHAIAQPVTSWGVIRKVEFPGCNAEGATTPVAGLPSCPQGISAVKAIALAAAQGQKIYTITREVYANNPNIVNANLANLSQSTKQAIQEALDGGYEVTTHESPITQSGWTGAGYTFIDPNTGLGGILLMGGVMGERHLDTF